MKFTISLIVVLFLIFSCNTTSEENKNQAPTNDASIIFGDKNYNYPPLSEPAKIQAVNWGVLEDFLAEARNANGSNYQDLRNSTENLKQYSDSLLKKIPDTLDTKSIYSRLMVVKTRSILLHQISHRATIDSLKVMENLDEMNIAVTNLIIQLNEKFQKDKIDYQGKDNEDSELKKQRSFKDSIMNLELQDKKNK